MMTVRNINSRDLCKRLFNHCHIRSLRNHPHTMFDAVLTDKIVYRCLCFDLSDLVLQFLSRTVFVPEAGVIGGLLLAAGLAIQLFVIRCPECGAHLPLFPGEYCKYCGNRLDWDKPLRR